MLPTRPRHRLRHAAAVLAIVAGAAASSSLAQSQQPLTDTQLLRDFSHYVRINQHELAAATGQQLLDRGLSPAEFAALVEDSPEAQRFEETILRAQRQPALEDIAARILSHYEQGKLDQARDPGEISRNIGLLTGSGRQKNFAVQRLRAAGEYAAPQLLEALIQRNDPQLAMEVRRVLVDLGRHAVVPLCTALPSLDPSAQELVVSLLGDIDYQTSVPYLYDLWASSPSEPLRKNIELAIAKLTGHFAQDVSVSGLYLALGENYYSEPPSLTSFPGEPYQLLWSYDPGIGLVAQAIATPVFHEAMAMRCAERALMLEPTDSPALPLWLAANFSREIDTPEGYENPAYPSTRRDATYYAVAAGAGPCERVLARGLATRDTPLVRRAIAAIERTAGPAAMFNSGEGNALLEALRYPNRRVQYEAAVAIGAASPRLPFDGSDRVVPILASAVRDASARFAVVLADDTERQTALADTLRGAGYTVLPPGRTLADVEAAIAEAPGIDLIVTDLSSANRTGQLIEAARGTSRLAATPVLSLASLDGWAELSARFERDATVRVARVGISADQLVESVNQLLETAVGGPITEEEAAAYKDAALTVLRDLAVSGNTVLNAADAALPLITAISNHTGELRLRIGEVLSYINSKRAQVALMDAALQDQGADRVAMLAHVAASAKRFGNLLEPRQVNRAVELARTGEGEEATAAAALMGALNLPNDQLIPLIISAK